MNDNQRKKFINVVKAAFGFSESGASMSESDVRALRELAIRQSILPIIIVGLKNLGYDDLLSPEMKKQSAKAGYDYIQRREALKQISSVLDDAHISYIPLKGSVLRELYPQPSMRTSSDIDVLIHKEDLKLATRALESGTSFRYYATGHHDIHMKNERLHLELHFSLLTNISKLDQVLEKAWLNAKQEGAGARYAFSPEYQVFYITAHAAKHFIKEGGVGIRPLLDLWLLRTKTEYDEAKVKTLCEEGGIFGFYEMCCELLSVWFNNSEYTDATIEFEELVLDGGVFGSERIKVIARERKNKGAKYLIRRIFLPSRDIRESYPRSDKYPVLVPMYQVVRWTHLLKSSKRKAASAELRETRVLNPDEIEKYDRIAKRMGL